MNRRFPRLWLALVAAVGLLTAVVLAWPPTSAGPWLDRVLLPALVGSFVAGGVHGDSPPWLLMLAMSASNGLAWGSLLFVAVRAGQRIRQIRG